MLQEVNMKQLSDILMLAQLAEHCVGTKPHAIFGRRKTIFFMVLKSLMAHNWIKQCFPLSKLKLRAQEDGVGQEERWGQGLCTILP